MIAYYGVLDKLKELLDADVAINTVTKGSLDDIDLTKTTMYGLAHVMVNSFEYRGNIVSFNVSTIVMDLVDISKESTTDIFKGNDNEDDVLNTTMAVIIRLLEQLRRGDAHIEGYALDGNASNEPFTDRFENKVAGWVSTFNILVNPDMTICD